MMNKKQLKEIADGYKNSVKSKLGLSSEEDERIFKERRAICDACDRKSDLDKCLECGCPLDKKTKSLISNCPLGKW